MTSQEESDSGRVPVLIDSLEVGTVLVAQRLPLKIFGVFVPGPHFVAYEPVFAAAARLSGEFEASFAQHGCDDPLWERLMEAYDAIRALGPTLGDLSLEVAEFAVDADWSVEITLQALARA